jgi:hypothetical protein
MDKHCLGFLLVVILCTFVSSAQTVPPSDPQALSLAAQSLLAMTGGTPISDANLTGTAVWTAGSDQQTGTVTLLAKGFVESRVDLNLSGGTKSEIRNSNASPDEGNWIGPDSVVHAIALHNCFTDSSWFFPALGSLAAVATNPNVVLTYVGLESSLQHIHAYTYDAQLPDAQQLSAMDFYLDPQTLLPQVVIFNEHPDDDQTVNIAVEVMFSDYRNVNGVTIAFHIQRFVNNSLMLDVQLASANINSGLSDNQFSVQ